MVLLDTFRANGQTRAQVEIDGTVYNVAMGESFGPGGRYELRSVSGDCATILFGDESFTLCTTPQNETFAERSSGGPPTGGAVAGHEGGLDGAALASSAAGRRVPVPRMVRMVGC